MSENNNKKGFKEKIRHAASTPPNPTVLMWLAFIVIFLCLIVYFLYFSVWPLLNCIDAGRERCSFGGVSRDTGTWGEFGDFLGGTVNPIIGMLTIWLLVGELKETRRASEDARAAQERAEKALREQLIEAKSQNNFANYYKHFEEFRAYIGVPKHLRINARSLYHLIFKGARDGTFSASDEVVNEFFGYRERVGRLLKGLDTTDVETVLKVMVDMYEIAALFEVHISGTIKVGHRISGVQSVNLPHCGAMTIGCETIGLFLHALVDKFAFYERVLEFDAVLQLGPGVTNELTFQRMSDCLKTNLQNGKVDEFGFVENWVPTLIQPEVIVKI